MLHKKTLHPPHSKALAQNARFLVVVSLYNRTLTQNLETACIETLVSLGADKASIDVAYVPGAFEIPLACLKHIQKAKQKPPPYCVAVALGVIVQGSTYHFELVAQGCAQGVMEVMLKTKTPIIFEVLAGKKDDMVKRAGTDKYNKGVEAAHAAVGVLEQ